MNVLGTLLLWSILFVLCWPLAIVVLILWPLIWLLTLPFRLFGFVFSSVLALVLFLILLPFKIVASMAASKKTVPFKVCA